MTINDKHVHSLIINHFLSLVILDPLMYFICRRVNDVSGYLSSLEERVWRQLLQLVGGHIKPVELLQQGEGSLRDEVQHVVVQTQGVEARHPLQAAGSRLNGETRRERRRPEANSDPDGERLRDLGLTAAKLEQEFRENLEFAWLMKEPRRLLAGPAS